MSNPFEAWLELQLELQKEHMKDGDPRSLDPEQRATFVTWNHTAAVLELGEAMNEIGWKPWGTGRDINEEAFLKEIVDALHFIGNMVLAAADEAVSTRLLAAVLWQMYNDKHQENARRQQEGYDGQAEKCPTCHRELVYLDPENGSRLGCTEHGRIG